MMAKASRRLIIDGVRIGDDTDAYVIAEPGHNHGGSLDTAKAMIADHVAQRDSSAWGLGYLGGLEYALRVVESASAVYKVKIYGAAARSSVIRPDGARAMPGKGDV